jgi:hypothetical protein
VTRESVLRASDAWVWVPDGAQGLNVAGVRVIDYPDWAHMGFRATPTTVERPVADIVDEIQHAAAERGRSEVSWWISPSTTPALEERLIAAGAVQTEELEIVAYDMFDGPPEISIPADVDCRLVSDPATLDDAEQVAAVVWGGNPSSGERREQQLQQLGGPLDTDHGFRVVAYLADRPIATAGCEIAGDVARLYGGGTLPEARGRGGYRATVRRRLEIAWQHGARIGLVQARVGTSMPILKRLGFKAYGTGRLYALPVSASGSSG